MKKAYPLFSDEDSDLSKYSWLVNTDGYARRTTTENKRWKHFFAHRVILQRIVGRELTRNDVCDHINGNKLDNRRDNLRLTSALGNGQNKSLLGKYRGTTCIKWKWQSQVGHRKKAYYLGVFSTREEAAEAARNKRIELGFLGDK